MTSRVTSSAAASGDPLAILAAVDALVALACEATGFDGAAVSRDSMRRLAETHVARVGVSAVIAACTRREASLAAECVRACIVNETYLFRQPEHFAFVAAFVRNQSLALVGDAAVGDAHVIRAWSAGCATGEEAWSLAATLRAAASNSGARVEVLGTDLVAAHVDAARAGVCRPPRHPSNEARSSPEAVAHAEFPLRTAVSDVVDEHGVVREHLRSLVRFAPHDLRAPAPANHFDIVFCRNVLMFLSQDVAASVLVHLANALAPGGVLVLGPVDTTALAPGCLPAGLVPFGPPELSVFARATAAAPRASVRAINGARTKRRANSMLRDPMVRDPLVRDPLVRDPLVRDPMVTRVQLDVERPVDEKPVTPPSHLDAVDAHLRALNALERGDLDGAMQHLGDATRKAPNYVPALVERALLLDRAGDIVGAARAMNDARLHLATLADDDIVPGPEPLPARFWSASVRAFLDRATPSQLGHAAAAAPPSVGAHRRGDDKGRAR